LETTDSECLYLPLTFSFQLFPPSRSLQPPTFFLFSVGVLWHTVWRLDTAETC